MAQYEVEVVFTVEAEDKEAAWAMVRRMMPRHWRVTPKSRRDGFEICEMFDGGVTEVE